MLFAVIDDKPQESHPEHETQLATIRWYLSEGMWISRSSPSFSLHQVPHSNQYYVLSYSPSFRNLRFCWQRFDWLQKLSYFNKDFWFKHLLLELEFRMKQSILCMLDLSVICTWKGKWYLRVRSCYFEALPFYNIIVSLLAKVRETYKKSQNVLFCFLTLSPCDGYVTVLNNLQNWPKNYFFGNILFL